MDNIRLILVLAFGGVLFMIYSAWIDDYGPSSHLDVAQREISSKQSDLVEEPYSGPAISADIPSVQTVPIKADRISGNGVVEDPIVVQTDLFRAEIARQGGTIENLWLKKYAATAGDFDQHFELLKGQTPNLFIVQSGLLGEPQNLIPTHETLFQAEQTNYELTADENNLSVRLHWSHPDGIQVTNTYEFIRGSYSVRLSQQIVNDTARPIQVRSYQQLQRTEYQDPNKSKFGNSFIGGAYFADKFEKIAFQDMEAQPLDLEVKGGWIALVQHYFLAAWIPPESDPQRFYTKVLKDENGATRYIIGEYSNPVQVNPGERHTFAEQAFIGPKLSDQLATAAPGLNLAIDYGWLTILADPIHWLLSQIHKLVKNWGWSIIILTILIKAAFYKLSEASYISMAQMRKFTPRMKALKDRFGDDKERLNQAMMELYKKEKINPLGGCLPILVQIPVFIALYWVLQQSVELRHAPFILWLNNLTAPDPYYILPLIMGVSMFVQQKLNPPPPDPVQEKIMMSLPVVFTVFFAFFPSGLVLYWTVNNLLSIAQQWYITRKIESAEKHRSS